jgi:hypothetical protein
MIGRVKRCSWVKKSNSTPINLSRVKSFMRSSPRKSIIPKNFTKVKSFIRSSPRKSKIVYVSRPKRKSLKKSRKNYKKCKKYNTSSMISVYDTKGSEYIVPFLTLLTLLMAGYIFYNKSGCKIIADDNDTMKICSEKKDLRSLKLDNINVIDNCEEYKVKTICLESIQPVIRTI